MSPGKEIVSLGNQLMLLTSDCVFIGTPTATFRSFVMVIYIKTIKHNKRCFLRTDTAFHAPRQPSSLYDKTNIPDRYVYFVFKTIAPCTIYFRETSPVISALTHQRELLGFSRLRGLQTAFPAAFVHFFAPS